MWLAEKIAEIQTGETLKQKIEKMMSPENLKIEFRNMVGQWETNGREV